MEPDTVIIGSGVSGLTIALILAKEGRRVLVLEQHSRPGGLMQNFRRGSLVFPTGVHRLGALDEGQILWRYFKYLGVLDNLDLVRMSSEGFEEYCFPGLRFKVPQGHEAFRERLHQYFPAHQAAVDRFFLDMERTTSQFALYNLHNKPEGWIKPDTRPLNDYLDELGCSPELKAVLTAINPSYGIPPASCPLHTHFLVMDSYLKSSWRVNESRTPLAEAFILSLKSHGGHIRCNALVEGIACQGSRVDGVQLAGGEYIPAKLVIFTGHPRQLLRLCPPGAFRPVFRTRLQDSSDTYGAFVTALRWPREDCPLARCDSYLYRDWDTGKHYHQRMTAGQSPAMVFCSALPRGADTGHSVVAMIGMAPDDVAPFAQSRVRTRGEAYLAFKRSIAARILEVVKNRWPETAGSLEIVETCSPLTFRDYTLAPGGTAYGISKSVTSLRSSMFTATTKIKDLFLAGQSIIQPGVLGALISGVHAGAVILGHDYLVARIVKETQ
jgi:phytoene dehydrogenase-like protein